MAGDKKKYDLICSLGGNCSAAHNIAYRNMRKYALPFDWCFIKNETPLKYLKEGFQNNFKNFLLKENLEPLSDDEYTAAHANRAQYKDTYTGYYFVNHFNKDKSFEEEYPIVYEKLRRRLTRLQKKLIAGKDILFILSTYFQIDTTPLRELLAVLSSLYPDKNIEFMVISFNCKEDKKYILDEKIQVMEYTRSTNIYDFYKTNYEWIFMDDISLKNKKKRKKSKASFLKISKLHKGIGIYILSNINTVLRTRLYLFGLRIDFCIGKVRE